VIIKKRLEDVKEGFSNLKEYVKLGKEKFLESKDKIGSAKYEIIKTFEALSSICSHIVVKKFKIKPPTYASCFEILAEKKVISQKLAKNLVNMARFRNLLIHMYYKIDDEKFFENLSLGLKDIEEFISAIEKLIKNEKTA